MVVFESLVGAVGDSWFLTLPHHQHQVNIANLAHPVIDPAVSQEHAVLIAPIALDAQLDIPVELRYGVAVARSCTTWGLSSEPEPSAPNVPMVRMTMPLAAATAANGPTT